jgi:hypothetical protein
MEYELMFVSKEKIKNFFNLKQVLSKEKLRFSK